jgi:hypothetical protein
MGRREVVCFVNNEDAVTGLGDVLGSHGATTAGADNNNIGLNDVSVTPLWDLQKGKVVPVNLLPIRRNIGVTNGAMENRAGRCSCFLRQRSNCLSKVS